MSQRNSGDLRQISRHIVFNFLSRVIDFSSRFLIIPFMIHHMGKQDYGFYVTMMAMVGLVSLLTTGLSNVVAKQTATYFAASWDRSLNQLINTVFTVVSGISLLAALILWLGAPYWISWFNFDLIGQEQAVHIMKLMALGIFLQSSTHVFNEVLRGLQKFKILSMLDVLFVVGHLGFVWIYLHYGQSLFLILLSFFVMHIMRNMMAYCVFSKILHHFKLKLCSFHRRSWIIMCAYGIPLFMSGLMYQSLLHLDKLMCVWVVSLSAVAIYKIASMFDYMILVMWAVIGDTLWSWIAALEGERNFEQQRKIFMEGTFYLMFMMVPAVGTLYCFLEPLIYHWLGEGFQTGVLVAKILVGAWFYRLMASMAHAVMSAKGRVNEILPYQAWTMALTLVLYVVLGYFWGLVGFAWGTVLPILFLFLPLSLKKTFSVMNVSWRDYLTSTVVRIAPLVASVFFVSFVLLKLYTPSHLGGVLVMMILAYAVTIGLGMCFILSSQERAHMKQFIPYK